MSVAWKGLHVLPPAQPERIPTRVCSVIDDPFYDEQPSDSEEALEAPPVYEDKFIKLSSDFLTIKSYYFPSGKAKRLAVSAITAIRREKNFTAWGTIDAKVWWNYDFLRDRRLNNDSYFVVECNEKFDKGFTCKKPSAFWKHFSSLRPELTQHQAPPRRCSQSSISHIASSRMSEDSLLIDNVME